MTYDQLRMLAKIAETGSIMAAAEALYRTQPAVSIAIRKLEEEFDLKILSRDHYRATLTPEGQALYQKAKVILRHTEAFETLGKEMAMGKEPEIRIAIDLACPLPPILEILKNCEKEHPHTVLNLMAESLGGTMEQLLDGNVDMIILPWLSTDPEVESIFFTKIQGGVVAAPNFPPAQSKHELSLEEMKEYVQIIVRDSSRHTPKRSHLVLEGGRHWKVTDFYTKKQIILAGMGWGGLPYHLIEEEFANGRLVPLNIKNLEPWGGDIRVVRRRDQPVGPVASQLWNDFQHGLPMES